MAVAEWILSSSLLILLAALLRRLLRGRVYSRILYGLWGLVLIRLLLPVQLFSAPVSLSGFVDTLSRPAQSSAVLPQTASRPEDLPASASGEDGGVQEDGNNAAPSGGDTSGAPSAALPVQTIPQEGGNEALPSARPEEQETGASAALRSILPAVWGLGAGGVLLAVLVSNVRFSRRLRRMRRPLAVKDVPLPVYVARGLGSPCLCGLVRPAVYVTAEAAAEPRMLRHVLAHELTHLRHLDPLWSALRLLALALHWYNPLVWWSAVLSRRDGELACDEGALRRLGESERIAYGETLLRLLTAKPVPSDLLCCATTMTGEKRSLRERFQRLTEKPKLLLLPLAVLVIVAAGAVLFLFSGPATVYREVTLVEGVPYGRVSEEEEWVRLGEALPPPRAWAGGAGRTGAGEAQTLIGDPDIWGAMVSRREGWLVARYAVGMGTVDTYVYRTQNGGRTWAETSVPDVFWAPSAAGFLTGERMILAYTAFDGDGPAYLTKDGGETWEEIPYPAFPDEGEGSIYTVSIVSEGDRVSMALCGGGATGWNLVSEDLGDTWQRSSPLELVELSNEGYVTRAVIFRNPDTADLEAINEEITAIARQYDSTAAENRSNLAPIPSLGRETVNILLRGSSYPWYGTDGEIYCFCYDYLHQERITLEEALSRSGWQTGGIQSALADYVFTHLSDFGYPEDAESISADFDVAGFRQRLDGGWDFFLQYHKTGAEGAENSSSGSDWDYLLTFSDGVILPGVAIPEEEQIRSLDVDHAASYDSAAVAAQRADARPVTALLPNLSPEDFSSISYDVDPQALVDAVYEAMDHVTAENIDALWSLTAYLEGGTDTRYLNFQAGLTEHLVQITYRSQYYSNTCQVDCESLYQLVRRAGDPPEGTVDRTAYAQYQSILESFMDTALQTYQENAPAAGYSSWVVLNFTRERTLEEVVPGVTAQVYDLDFALLMEHPEHAFWVGGNYIDSQLRMRGVVWNSCFAAYYRGDALVRTAFLGHEILSATEASARDYAAEGYSDISSDFPASLGLLETEAYSTTSTEFISAFLRYYDENPYELRLLPDFSASQSPSWDALSLFAFQTAVWEDSMAGNTYTGSISAQRFAQVVQQYLGGLRYTDGSSSFLTYTGGRYVPTGWDVHGQVFYRLTSLQPEGDGVYRAVFDGVAFQEDDFFDGNLTAETIIAALREPDYRDAYAVSEEVEVTFRLGGAGENELVYLSCSRTELA